MSFRWRYEDGSGTPVTGPDLTFDDQAEAEEWFGAEWADLLAAGVHQVVLLDGGAEVYGPMSLHPPTQ
ncbi:hypothetical protein [Actinokineospora sp. NBRC 105648]|uniref:hypothetical protein n=1 Tax=Actinokineospora sp. NBRC 105648 TaxID=3032206 RepID=UPI0024A5F057|nr:hypothetical protein [Actinokineospora sp. NBRC 105648]GLZ42666.1 hypothetical protein Acsp05_62900 [Actinokineospora sp. NBRC 105648]